MNSTLLREDTKIDYEKQAKEYAPRIEDLLKIADETKAPNEIEEDKWWTDVEFKLASGWKVFIFYDGDELDYIDHFETPYGEVIDFWEWPSSYEKDTLINWRGCGDVKGLLDYMHMLKRCEASQEGCEE